jgi:hypothetical protein
MAVRVFHRRTQDSTEEKIVRSSRQLWGKSAATIAGNAEPAVRAYVGPLPDGENGYSFRTSATPSRKRCFYGRDAVEWIEGHPDVHAVPGNAEYVFIWVEVI